MKHIALVFVFLALVVTSGCSGMSRTQQTTLSGGAIGAGGGRVAGGAGGGRAGRRARGGGG